MTTNVNPIATRLILAAAMTLAGLAQQAMAQGNVAAWGQNLYGELGDGTYTDRSTPVTVSGLSSVIAIGGSKNFHSLALKSDGTPWAWGWNADGQLGNGAINFIGNNTPVAVNGLTNVIAVIGGDFHSLALKSDGTVWAWGLNNFGQLGDGTNMSKTVPIRVSGLTNVTAISAGYFHSLALKSDGTVWAWGLNDEGELGNGTNIRRNVPVQVTGLASVAAISAGGTHSLALLGNGTVVGWGDNFYGQLGDGTNTNHNTPVAISALTGVAGISCGVYHSLALSSDGTVRAWGYNHDGELGNNTNTDSNLPVPISGLPPAAAISGGGAHSLALLRDGTVRAWGSNYYGQLGDGTNTDRNTPVAVSGLSGVMAIAAGGSHSLAVVPLPQVTISSSPSGRSFSVSGAGCQAGNYVAPQTLSWIPSSSCTVNFVPAQSGTAGTQYVFNSWTDTANAGSSRVFLALASPSSYTATFTTQYLLTAQANPSAAGTVSGGGIYYDAGSSAMVTASANYGYGFQNWSGPVAGTTNSSTTVVMNAPQSVTANFIAQTPSTVTVTTMPAGLSFTVDGTTYTSGQTFLWAPSSQHVIATASPQPGAGTRFLFANWSDGGSISHMIAAPNGPITYTATFSTQYFLNTSAGIGGAISPAGGFYDLGASVPISATANAGYSFAGFTGDLTGSANPQNITMNAPHFVGASFSPVSPAVNPIGTVRAWGNNGNGQLGDGTYTNRTAPISVNGLTSVIAIASGNGHSLALKSDGSVWAWGSNSFGELGNGIAGAPSAVPVPVIGLTGVVAISSGGIAHSMALKSDGTVWTWGSPNDYNNHFGPGTTTPAMVPGLSGVVAISEGYDFRLALKNDGTVWAWGSNFLGDLGDGTNTDSSAPVAVSGLTNVIAVAAGNDHSLALKSDGTVVGWGSNFFGEIGNGTNAHSNTPLAVTGLSGVVAIAAGGFHCLALKNDGSVWTWGWNGWGQLGNGTNTDSTIPIPVTSLTNVTAISAGFYHSLALKNDGTVSAFGQSSFGQLGNGSNVDSNIPVAVNGLTGTLAISTRWLHSMALVPLMAQVTISSSPAGRSFSISGAGCQAGSYVTPQTLTWTAASCSVNFGITQSGTAGTQYLFSDWADDPIATNMRVLTTPVSSGAYTANFTTQYFLTTSANPAAGGAVSGAGWYTSGTNAGVTASANSGYAFQNWTGPVDSSTSINAGVLMNAPQSVTANFAALTPIIVGTSPAGLSFSVDGNVYTSAQSFQWVPGSPHTIATSSLQAGGAGIQYAWLNWSDSGAPSHAVNAPAAPTTYTANFKTQYLLTTAASPVAGGTISPATGFVDAGTSVAVSATASATYAFTGFSGALSGSTTPQNLVVNAPGSVTANFVQGAFTAAGNNITVQPVDPTTGGTPVTFTFNSVTQPGTTTVSTSNTGPPPAVGFSLGSPPVYYSLATTATFSGSIAICIDYTGISFATPPLLMHFENGVWVDVTTSQDTVRHIVCGSVTSLSPFGLFRRIDTNPPVTAATTTGTTGANSWFTSNITVTLTATDNAGGSGVKEITYGATGAQPIASNTVSGSAASFSITTEGTTTITYSAKDNAGNIEAARTLVLKLDKTAPVIAAPSVTGTLVNGWYTSVVSIVWNVTDAQSGIASSTGCAPASISADTSGVTITCTAANNAGLVASVPLTMKIDKTAPVTTATPAPGTLPQGVPLLLTVNAAGTVKTTSGATLGTITAQCFDTPGMVIKLAAADNSGGSGVNTVTYAGSGAQAIPSTVVNGAMTQVSVTKPGVTTLTFEAKDVAGNREAGKSESVLVGIGDDQIGFACAAPTPAFAMPGHGSISLSGTVTVAGRDIPFHKNVIF